MSDNKPNKPTSEPKPVENTPKKYSPESLANYEEDLARRRQAMSPEDRAHWEESDRAFERLAKWTPPYVD